MPAIVSDRQHQVIAPPEKKEKERLTLQKSFFCIACLSLSLAAWSFHRKSSAYGIIATVFSLFCFALSFSIYNRKKSVNKSEKPIIKLSKRLKEEKKELVSYELKYLKALKKALSKGINPSNFGSVLSTLRDLRANYAKAKDIDEGDFYVSISPFASGFVLHISSDLIGDIFLREIIRPFFLPGLRKMSIHCIRINGSFLEGLPLNVAKLSPGLSVMDFKYCSKLRGIHVYAEILKSRKNKQAWPVCSFQFEECAVLNDGMVKKKEGISEKGTLVGYIQEKNTEQKMYFFVEDIEGKSNMEKLEKDFYEKNKFSGKEGTTVALNQDYFESIFSKSPAYIVSVKEIKYTSSKEAWGSLFHDHRQNLNSLLCFIAVNCVSIQTIDLSDFLIENDKSGLRENVKDRLNEVFKQEWGKKKIKYTIKDYLVTRIR